MPPYKGHLDSEVPKNQFDKLLSDSVDRILTRLKGEEKITDDIVIKLIDEEYNKLGVDDDTLRACIKMNITYELSSPAKDKKIIEMPEVKPQKRPLNQFDAQKMWDDDEDRRNGTK